ncbi:hypothetical protein TNCT_141301 [Trichonephila clavata]|uniref:Uncharacterized protein n=1 Tax=Trichonephila clavata TaxID=2740835 RepID=A0A8X6LKY6_TRICU|nr:hypothetical protein TNCT_130591 [Trichonephila clavata]GFR14561.1 hypothetical protein TNCT_141301 [Trichonephila clavata]
MTKTSSKKNNTKTKRIINNDTLPFLFNVNRDDKALCNSDIMPVKMINEIPLPIPLALIRSPSHIKSIVPPKRLKTPIVRNITPGSITTNTPSLFIPSNPTKIGID